MSAYMDRKILAVLDKAGPVGAMAYGCALSGQDVPFEQVYPIACERARELGVGVPRKSEALGTFHLWSVRGREALTNARERSARTGCPWRVVQR